MIITVNQEQLIHTVSLHATLMTHCGTELAASLVDAVTTLRTQPWFYRQLNGTTTSAIEVRICHGNGFSVGYTLVDQLELYVQ